MFRNLLARLFTEESVAQPLASDDADIAVAALLVRVARADDHYSHREKMRIEEVLAHHQGLSPVEASAFYAMTNSVPNASARWMNAAQMGQWVRIN